MPVRLLLLAAAVALVVLGVHRDHARDQCDTARREAFAVGTHKLPVTDAGGIADRLIDHCRDVGEIVDGASALVRARATGAAAKLADEAVAREPQRRNSWLAAAAVARLRGDDAANRRALARARQLDPLSFRS
jgi:hypothetical protein